MFTSCATSGFSSRKKKSGWIKTGISLLWQWHGQVRNSNFWLSRQKEHIKSQPSYPRVWFSHHCSKGLDQPCNSKWGSWHLTDEQETYFSVHVEWCFDDWQWPTEVPYGEIVKINWMNYFHDECWRKKSNQVYISSLNRPGCDWTLLYVDLKSNKWYYSDTSCWRLPLNLKGAVSFIVSIEFCACLPSRLLELLKVMLT